MRVKRSIGMPVKRSISLKVSFVAAPPPNAGVVFRGRCPQTDPHLEGMSLPPADGFTSFQRMEILLG